jgi:hypothetical protein
VRRLVPLDRELERRPPARRVPGFLYHHAVLEAGAPVHREDEKALEEI